MPRADRFGLRRAPPGCSMRRTNLRASARQRLLVADAALAEVELLAGPLLREEEVDAGGLGAEFAPQVEDSDADFDQRAAQADYIRSVAAPAPSASEEIARLASLRDSGALTDEEYAGLKAKALT